jgi:hypothetical protein
MENTLDNKCRLCGQFPETHDEDGKCIVTTDHRRKRATVTFLGGGKRTYTDDCWGDLLHYLSGRIEDALNPDLIESIYVERY